MRRIGADIAAAIPLWTVPAVQAAVAVDASAVEAARSLQAQHADALDRGFQEGLARGLAKAQEAAREQHLVWQQKSEAELTRSRAQYDQARGKLEALAASLSQRMDSERDRAEEVAIEVAYSAVVRVLGEEYGAGDLMPDLVRHAMKAMTTEVDSIVLSKDDAETLSEVDGVQVVVDPRLQPGQCRLKTRFGSRETGLDVRLDMLRTGLLTGLGQYRVGTKA